MDPGPGQKREKRDFSCGYGVFHQQGRYGYGKYHERTGETSVLLYGQDEVTRADIDAVCITQITNHIFEMVNAVAEQDQRKALELYYDLLALREQPMHILALMAKQYRDLFHVKELAGQGYPRREIASRAGLHPFVAGKYEKLSGRFTSGQLRAVMEEIADLDQRIKTGLITDHLAVEVFIVKHAKK